MVMYLPISSVAYFIYGKNVQSNILLTKSRDVDNKEVSDVINQVVEVLITIHLILGLLIVINLSARSWSHTQGSLDILHGSAVYLDPWLLLSSYLWQNQYQNLAPFYRSWAVLP